MLFPPGSLRVRKPKAGGVAWAYNLLNLFIILFVTPSVAILLMKADVSRTYIADSVGSYSHAFYAACRFRYFASRVGSLLPTLLLSKTGLKPVLLYDIFKSPASVPLP